MTAILNDVILRKAKADQSAEAKAAAEQVRLAKEQGLSLADRSGRFAQAVDQDGPGDRAE